jgi:hypothetical protein
MNIYFQITHVGWVDFLMNVYMHTTRKIVQREYIPAGV